MIKRRFAALAATLLLPLAAAHAKDWQVDPGASTLGFDGAYQGQAFHGVFRHFDATIHYDPKDLSRDSFDVTVPLDSVDTQSPERDQTLKGDAFFDVAKHPSAHFVTQSFTRTAAGQVEAHGRLTLNGITRPVTLKVDFEPHGNTAVLDVTTSVDRTTFGLGTSSDWNALRKRVDVHGHLQLH